MHFHTEIARIPIDTTIIFVNQRIGLGDVVHVCGGHCDRIDVDCSDIRARMELHADFVLCFKARITVQRLEASIQAAG